MPDSNGAFFNDQSYDVGRATDTTATDYKTIVERAPNRHDWPGGDRLWLESTAYDRKVETYRLGQVDFRWFKDGPAGTITQPPPPPPWPGPPAISPPDSDDMRMEYERNGKLLPFE